MAAIVCVDVIQRNLQKQTLWNKTIFSLQRTQLGVPRCFLPVVPIHFEPPKEDNLLTWDKKTVPKCSLIGDSTVRIAFLTNASIFLVCCWIQSFAYHNRCTTTVYYDTKRCKYRYVWLIEITGYSLGASKIIPHSRNLQGLQFCDFHKLTVAHEISSTILDQKTFPHLHVIF